MGVSELLAGANKTRGAVAASAMLSLSRVASGVTGRSRRQDLARPQERRTEASKMED